MATVGEGEATGTCAKVSGTSPGFGIELIFVAGVDMIGGFVICAATGNTVPDWERLIRQKL